MSDVAESWPVDDDNPRRRWHRTDVTKIERRQRDYDAAFLEAAAEVLNCSKQDLIARHPQHGTSIPPEDLDRVLAALERVNPDERKRVLKLIESYASEDAA